MTLAKSAVTREAIQEAARNAFARKGYSATSVTEIAQDLHVTRANFYYYYRDKEQLFVELGTATYRDTIGLIEAFSLLEHPPELEQVRGWVESYFHHLDHNGAFLVRAIDDCPDDPDFRAKVKRLHRKSASQLGGYITARSTGAYTSAVSIGMSVMAMLERSWLLARATTVDHGPAAAIRSNAEILWRMIR